MPKTTGAASASRAPGEQDSRLGLGRGRGPQAPCSGRRLQTVGVGGGPQRGLCQPGRRAQQEIKDAVRHGAAAQVSDLCILRVQAGV